MRTYLGILAVVFISSTFASGYYYDSGSGFGGFGSYWDSKDADDTWGGGAILRLGMGPQWQVDFRGSYYEFSQSTMGFKETLEIIPVEAALMFRMPLEHAFTLYAGGGGGYYFADYEAREGGEKLRLEIDGDIGFFVLGGAQFRIGEALSLFGEAKYIWLDFGKAKFKGTGIPELEREKFDIDLKMDGLAINIGLLFNF